MNRYSTMPPVIKNLLIINILAFMAVKMLPIGCQLGQSLSLSLGTAEFHTYQ